MKIAFNGLNIDEGKVKYNDPIVTALSEKFEPDKVSPYYFEFIKEGYEESDAIATTSDRILDLLIPDLETLNSRLERVSDKQEKDIISRCISHLEEERPLCNLALPEEELKIVRTLNLISMKPVALDPSPLTTDVICEAILENANRMFFYTAGKKEVHAWLVKRGATALECAEKIHSDLARGFIKAEIIPFEKLLETHNMQSARKEGLIDLVDKHYVIPEKTVLEIRFNV